MYGLIHFSYHIGGTDSDPYCNFLQELIKEFPCNNEPFNLTMDNAKMHHTEKVQNVCEFSGQFKHTIKYLPSYSPHLNLIEIAFSAWKYELKKIEKPDTTTTFEAIKTAAKKQ